MKILKIVVKQFKAIKDLDAEINGGNIIIYGENGVGKTSLMQFIEIALGKNTHIPPNAEGEGYVVADKNGNKYTFHVKFKDHKPVLTITTPDGLSDSRKGSIAAIVGAINFDINEFVENSKSEKGRKEQVETFKNLLPPEIKSEIARLEANVKSNYDLRADVNKALKATQGKIELHPLNKHGVYLDEFKEVNISDVYAKLNEASAYNTKLSEVASRKNEREQALIAVNRRIEDLKKALQLAEEEQQSLQFKQIEAAKYLEANKPIDITVIQSQIDSANETNEQYKSAQELIQLLKDAEIYKEQSGTLTAGIESQRQTISDAIKDMSNPVPGLTFDDNGLLYNGTPVNPDSLSFSEIIELGVKMKIAENPELPLFINNGESIGNKRLHDIKEIAERSGLQIIMEHVQRGQEKLTIEVMGE